MRRTRRTAKRVSPPKESSYSSSDDEPLIKKKFDTLSVAAVMEIQNEPGNSGSSSESDIESYLKPPDQIDLSSSFFTVKSKQPSDVFEAIEKDIFSGIQRLSDSDSESSDKIEANIKTAKTREETKKHRFEHLHAYSKKLEDTRKLVDEYKAKRELSEENNLDIDSLLMKGEAKSLEIEANELYSSLQSSDFESLSESEREDWEEVHTKEDRCVVPKEGVEIRVEMPDAVRKKKKGFDLMAALKRRLNRIKKENQVYVHQVHLLCWIAHGNYINKILNKSTLLGLALSLLPSQHCYPPSRLDLIYLEQLLTWFKKAVSLRSLDKTPQKNRSLEEAMQAQISGKEADDYKTFVYIFICVLRSLGVRVRLVLSLQVEPLRPPTSELCSVSNKEKAGSTLKNTNDKSVSKTPKVSHRKSEIKLGAKRNLSSPCQKDGSRIRAECGQEATSDNVKRKIKQSKGEAIKLNTAPVQCQRKSLRNGREGEDVCEAKCTKKSRSSQNSSSKIGRNNEEKTTGRREIKKPLLLENEKDVKRVANAKTAKKSRLEKERNNADWKLDKKGSKRSKPLKEEIRESDGRTTKTKTVNKSDFEQFEKGNSIQMSNRKRSNRPKSAMVKEEKADKESQDELCLPTSTENPDERSATLKSEIYLKEEPIADEVVEQETLKVVRRSSRLSSKSPTDFDQKEKKMEKQIDEASIESKAESKRGRGQTHKPNLFKVKVNFRKIKRSNLSAPCEDSKININGVDSKERSTESVKVKSENVGETWIPQVDGTNDSDCESSPTPSRITLQPKLNLSKLKTELKSACTIKKHPSRLKSSDTACKDRGGTFTISDGKTQSEAGRKSTKTTTNLNLKKLQTPLDIKLANLRNLTRSHSGSTSSDSGRSKFFEGSPKKKQIDVRNDIISIVKQSITQEKENRRKPIKKKQTKDDDFKQKVVKVKQRVPMKKDLIEVEKRRKEEKEEQKKKKGINVWLEVFAEAEEKWISVDIIKGKLHCVNELHTRATQPVSYILAWDNDSYIKDISKRYCNQWNTVTRKLRCDPNWWNATLKPFEGPKTAREKEEDDELAREQLEKPLPTTISEYKDHPLYVLKRHLLKFQAIYPPDAVTLGFIRNEPVYSRDCVYVLHSRELWLKEAKVVKVGEQPYKIVKARPKWDKLSNTVITDKLLEIFGVWQVEDYIPPTAVNGIVPRNAYGNVELFKPCMLPKGTVHLQLPGLNKVAKKQNVDCAPAVTGFDFHGGWNHAVYDGYIVCAEHEDKLVAAWYLEQDEAEKRAQEKIEKRVYDNWRKLIKGLLIRERLKARYDFGLPTTESKGTKTKKKDESGRL